MNGELEHRTTAIPGPRTAARLSALQRYESRNVTYLADDFPIVWESAAGATVVDVDGNRYLDLTAGFGVANTGHANPRVVAAIGAQAARLMHAMGDVHPSDVRMRLLERLAAIFPTTPTKAFLATTGSEAVEAALKTAMLATGRNRFATFRGAYHGLSLGTLPVGGLEKFREPFAAALGPTALLLDYPNASTRIDAQTAIGATRATLQDATGIAAVVIEPIQGRGGCIVPPDGYLTALRALCDELGALLLVDEIYTGFGRTGTWFAVDRERVVPDIVCIGKAMGSGVPISAIVAKAEIMDAWPVSTGEALHTSTYLGNPIGCAAALATFEEMDARKLPERAASLEPLLRDRLGRLRSRAGVADVRGRGLLWGIQLADAARAQQTIRAALRAGLIVLQSGCAGDVIAISPPLVISQRQLERSIDLLEAALDRTE